MSPDSSPTPETTPQYGFLIDQRKCIGCHACTVACKAENEVPLGKFRTWVKYTEKGTFPDVKRHFTVMRCNHCDAAPCVDICPVNALHKRLDAIVDLDRDACIGCRGCMQACPYDALYLNEDTGVAEKCHYCAHRTELGLEPACVVVCPERAIVPGDVADPNSEIATAIRDLPTERRKVEKGTKPRVWYVDALPESLKPGSTTEPPQYLWANRQTPQPAVPPGMEPPEDVITTLDVGHPPVWGWHIWWYLLTKNIAAGAMLFAPVLALLGVEAGIVRDFAPEVVGLVFLGITLFLLIHDLGRPERFLKLLITPNTKSWLVKGGWVLTAFGLLTAASIAARIAGANGVADLIRWINWPVALLTSGYSAWLFGQCRGRDLWLGKTLFFDLTTRALLLGAGMALLVVPSTDYGGAVAAFVLLGVAVVVSSSLEGKYLLDTDHARRAHALLETHDPGIGFRKRIALALAYAVMPVLIGLLPESEKLSQVIAFGIGLVAVGLYSYVWLRDKRRPAARDPAFGTTKTIHPLLVAAVLLGSAALLSTLQFGAHFFPCAIALFIATNAIFDRERSWVHAGQAVPIS